MFLPSTIFQELGVFCVQSLYLSLSLSLSLYIYIYIYIYIYDTSSPVVSAFFWFFPSWQKFSTDLVFILSEDLFHQLVFLLWISKSRQACLTTSVIQNSPLSVSSHFVLNIFNPSFFMLICFHPPTIDVPRYCVKLYRFITRNKTNQCI